MHGIVFNCSETEVFNSLQLCSKRILSIEKRILILCTHRHEEANVRKLFQEINESTKNTVPKSYPSTFIKSINTDQDTTFLSTGNRFEYIKKFVISNITTE